MTANHEITAIGLLALFLIFALGVCLFRAAFCSDWKPFFRSVREWRAEREARRHHLRCLQLHRDIRRGYKIADEARRELHSRSRKVQLP